MKSTITNHAIWMLSSAIQDLTRVNQDFTKDKEGFELAAIECVKRALYTLENDEVKL